eukprot:2517638-Rhodomonas_salina.2
MSSTPLLSSSRILQVASSTIWTATPYAPDIFWRCRTSHSKRVGGLSTSGRIPRSAQYYGPVVATGTAPSVPGSASLTWHYPVSPADA